MIYQVRVHWLLSTLLMLSLAGQVFAQGRSGRGAFGDWRVTVSADGRDMESIVALSRDPDGNRTGQWISFWGAADLTDIQFSNGDLNFAWSMQGFSGETWTSRFAGRIEDGKLTGTLSGDRGEFPVKGERVQWQPRAVGTWAMAYTIGDRDITATMKVTADADRNLSAEWEAERGEHKIVEIASERDQLTFKRSSTMNGRSFDITFTGALDRDALSGTFTSEWGETEVTGTRVGAQAIGTWMVDIESERGVRKQRLRINRDLSALFGAIEVASVVVDDNQITFPMELDFGDQSFAMSVQATIDGTSLTGELTTPQGTRTLSGTHVVRAPRTRGSR